MSGTSLDKPTSQEAEGVRLTAHNPWPIGSAGLYSLADGCQAEGGSESSSPTRNHSQRTTQVCDVAPCCTVVQPTDWAACHMLCCGAIRCAMFQHARSRRAWLPWAATRRSGATAATAPSASRANKVRTWAPVTQPARVRQLATRRASHDVRTGRGGRSLCKPTQGVARSQHARTRARRHTATCTFKPHLNAHLNAHARAHGSPFAAVVATGVLAGAAASQPSAAGAASPEQTLERLCSELRTPAATVAHAHQLLERHGLLVQRSAAADGVRLAPARDA